MVTKNHEDKQAASHEWLKNIVGQVKHNLIQDTKTGHKEQIVSNEHNEKRTSDKSRRNKTYISTSNNNKLFLQYNRTYIEYKTHMTKNKSDIKHRKTTILI